jgi:copper oxidase (laccase) domain-containing protein
MAWLGPAIGPERYEVGDDVRESFLAADAGLAGAFQGSGDRWMTDLYSIARHRLAEAGVDRIFGGGYCTASDTARFYSFRRDGVTGRMATVIWLDQDGPERMV